MRSPALQLLLALTLVVLATAHRFQNGLVYDDPYVLQGPMIHEPHRLAQVFTSHAMIVQGKTEVKALATYRPIPLALFFWDAWLSGNGLWSFHLTNLLAHLGAVAAVFALARRMLPERNRPCALVAALFFGLSPQLAEAHVWINGRSDPLCTAFGMSAILAWRAGLDASSRSRSVAMFALSGVLFLLGLGSKEVLVMVLPVLLLWPGDSQHALWARLRSLSGIALATVIYVVARAHALGGLKLSQSGAHRALALEQLGVLWLDGFAELFVPLRVYLRSMRDEYAALSSLQLLLAWLLCALLGALVFALRRRAPLPAWSLLWFAATLAPAAVISADLWPGFGRYLYLPCAGLAIGVADLAGRTLQTLANASSPALLRHGRRAMNGFSAAYFALFAGKLAIATADYQSNETLYSNILAHGDQQPHAFGWLGVHLRERGQYQAAVGALRKAIALAPDEPFYILALADAYLSGGDQKGAELVLQQALASQTLPLDVDALTRLISATHMRDPEAAVRAVCQCLTRYPGDAQCLGAPAFLTKSEHPRHDEYRQLFAQPSADCASPFARGFVALHAAERGP